MARRRGKKDREARRRQREAEARRLRKKKFLTLVTVLVGVLALVISAALLLGGREEVDTGQPVRQISIAASSYTFTPSTITLSPGERVRLLVTNTGGVHRFAIDELGIDKSLPAGVTTTIEFTGSTVGTFAFYCPVGSHRSRGMEGVITVE